MLSVTFPWFSRTCACGANGFPFCAMKLIASALSSFLNEYVPLVENTCVRSVPNSPAQFTRAFGSCEFVVQPSDLDSVYEKFACHECDIRFSTASTIPLYRLKKPGGLVRRKRLAVEK